EAAMADGPTDARRKVWHAYARDLASRLDAEERRRVRDELLRRARKVAEASGGVLGIAKVSAKEEKVLDALAEAFGGGAASRSAPSPRPRASGCCSAPAARAPTARTSRGSRATCPRPR